MAAASGRLVFQAEIVLAVDGSFGHTGDAADLRALQPGMQTILQPRTILVASNNNSPPGKHPDFIYYEKEPLNGAPPPFLTRGEFVTPLNLFYIRCHGDVPELDADSYRLRLQGLVATPLGLSLEELKSSFPTHRVAVTLQCAGNRRDELSQVKNIPGESPWAGNAISHGVWTGVRLADVLAHAGLDHARAKFVEFIGHDKAEKTGYPPFGGSVPLSKALAPETLLAYELDGQPLPVVHGFPVRAIVPGYLGARSVKWLREINVLDHPSENLFQAEEYRLHPASASKEKHDAKTALPMGEMPVTSYICRVHRGRPGGNDPMVVEGYAYVGAGHEIHRVEISEDEGERWTQTELLPVPGDGLQAADEEGGRWSWRFWRAELLAAERAPVQLIVRAWDTGANTQPARAQDVWNFKGYGNNAAHHLVSAAL